MSSPLLSFEFLAASLHLDPSTRQAAEVLVQSFLETEREETELPWLQRCALLAASRLQGAPLTLGQVARDEGEMHSVVLLLKRFLDKLQLREDVKRDLAGLKVAFTFSLTFFKKLDELWERLQLLDCPQLKHFTWLFFLLCKAQLLRKHPDIIETALLLIGVLHAVLLKLPFSALSPAAGKSPEELLQLLCDLMRTQAKFASPLADKATGVMISLLDRKILKEGKFNESGLEACCRVLSDLYSEHMSEIDEREFLGKGTTSRRLRTPMTPFTRQIDASRRLIAQRVQHYDTDSASISLHTRIQDIHRGKSPSHLLQSTPMTQALELNSWLAGLLEPIETAEVTDLLLSYCANCSSAEITERIGQFRSTLQVCVSANRLEDKVKTDAVLRLYLRLLELLLTTEVRRNAAADLNTILQSDSFHRSVLAASVEITCFSHNLAQLAFEDVLSVAGVSGFEFWKLISSLLACESAMPAALHLHFQLIEVRIVQKLGWTQGSPVHQALKYVGKREVKEQLHVTYDLFFRRVLAYSASRLATLAESLLLPTALQEDIWTALKHFLSNQTEILIDRHLDQLILCVIFGICKANSHILKFTTLVEQYALLNEGEKHAVCYQIPLDSSEVNIIVFYNQVVMSLIRDYTRIGVPESLRISALAPDSALRVSASAQFQRILQSPQSARTRALMTPTTMRLFASPESLGVRPSDKRLDFESEERKYDPVKRPRHLDAILQPCPAQSLSLPSSLKKES